MIKPPVVIEIELTTIKRIQNPIVKTRDPSNVLDLFFSLKSNFLFIRIFNKQAKQMPLINKAAINEELIPEIEVGRKGEIIIVDPKEIKPAEFK